MKIFYKGIKTFKVTVHNGSDKEEYTGIVCVDSYSDGGCKYVRLWTDDEHCHMIIDRDIDLYIEEE